MAVPFNYSWRNLWTRRFTTMLTAGGMALVTFVFAAVLMLAQGLEQTLVDTGSPDNAVVLRAAAETEVSSVIDRLPADIIVVQPQVAQTAAGDPIASKETLVLVTLPKKDANKPANVVIRGIGPQGMNLRPQVKLIAGRNIRPGTQEVIAGKSIAERIQGASLGGTLRFAMTDWTIVGILDAGRTAFDSELWVDVDQLMAAFRRNLFSAIIMKVPGQDAFNDLKKQLETDPRLTVQVKREIEFYREQSEVMARFIRILGVAMTVFFSIGAILGAMVTMYTAVANRTAEIGTLRALGFPRRHILAAFLTESLFLGLIGGAAGIGAGSLLQFLTISTVNWATFSELAFGFDLTASIALYALGFALAMGFVGGMLPSWRASRLKIVDALRAE
ncbi:MAG: ABC transporter permease [Desulfomonile tiedjei]|nr:ABC transporter permease [Desulfomonile tiedjei]